MFLSQKSILDRTIINKLFTMSHSVSVFDYVCCLVKYYSYTHTDKTIYLGVSDL